MRGFGKQMNTIRNGVNSEKGLGRNHCFYRQTEASENEVEVGRRGRGMNCNGSNKGMGRRRRMQRN